MAPLLWLVPPLCLQVANRDSGAGPLRITPCPPMACALWMGLQSLQAGLSPSRSTPSLPMPKCLQKSSARALLGAPLMGREAWGSVRLEKGGHCGHLSVSSSTPGLCGKPPLPSAHRWNSLCFPDRVPGVSLGEARHPREPPLGLAATTPLSGKQTQPPQRPVSLFCLSLTRSELWGPQEEGRNHSIRVGGLCFSFGRGIVVAFLVTQEGRVCLLPPHLLPCGSLCYLILLPPCRNLGLAGPLGPSHFRSG